MRTTVGAAAPIDATVVEAGAVKGRGLMGAVLAK
jgi:hypothetical protein